jgi:hypothetical protein
MYDLDELRGDTASRRSFLAKMSAAGLGVAALRLLTAPAGAMAAGQVQRTISTDEEHTTYANLFPGIPGATPDIIVGNFALTLELLEEDLYRQALNVASGFNIHNALSPDPSIYKLAISPGNLSDTEAQAAFLYLQEFTYVEDAHRNFLTAALTALGGPVVVRHPGGYQFPGGPGRDLGSILANILPLEETGVRAYLGALPYVGTLDFAQTAGTIYSTESRHSAVISQTIGIDPGPNPMPGDLRVVPRYPASNTFEYYLQPNTVLSNVSVYLK